MRASVIHGYWLLVALLYGLPLYAATLDITAEYNPATYEVGGAKFINTTPCTQFPTAAGFWCSTTATIDTPQAVRFGINISRTVNMNGNNREGIHYIGFSGARDVTLVKEGGGASYSMKFIITAVGSQLNLSLPSNDKIPDKGDCSGSAIWSNNIAIFLYRDVNINKQSVGGACYGNNSMYAGTKITVASAYLGYKLEAPNPLKMENGIYNGRMIFSIGNGKDLDFGNGTYTDPQLIVSFKVKVRHQIKVEFPSGGNKVVLQPPEGWINFVYDRKTAPRVLQQNLPFRIWYSAPFTVALRCQYAWGTDCALKDGKGRTVPLKTNYVHINNKMTPLTINAQKFILSTHEKSVTNGARAILFQVVGGTVAEMIKYPGSTYKGDVTLIFDASID